MGNEKGINEGMRKEEVREWGRKEWRNEEEKWSNEEGRNEDRSERIRKGMKEWWGMKEWRIPQTLPAALTINCTSPRSITASIGCRLTITNTTGGWRPNRRRIRSTSTPCRWRRDVCSSFWNRAVCDSTARSTSDCFVPFSCRSTSSSFTTRLKRREERSSSVTKDQRGTKNNTRSVVNSSTPVTHEFLTTREAAWYMISVVCLSVCMSVCLTITLEKLWVFRSYKIRILPSAIYLPSRASLRTALSGDLYVPRTRRRFGDRAFAATAPRVWNSLPTDIKLHWSTTTSFKRCLKTVLFNCRAKYM